MHVKVPETFKLFKHVVAPDNVIVPPDGWRFKFWLNPTPCCIVCNVDDVVAVSFCSKQKNSKNDRCDVISICESHFSILSEICFPRLLVAPLLLAKVLSLPGLPGVLRVHIGIYPVTAVHWYILCYSVLL